MHGGLQLALLQLLGFNRNASRSEVKCSITAKRTVELTGREWGLEMQKKWQHAYRREFC